MSEKIKSLPPIVTDRIGRYSESNSNEENERRTMLFIRDAIFHFFDIKLKDVQIEQITRIFIDPKISEEKTAVILAGLFPQLPNLFATLSKHLKQFYSRDRLPN